jgi:hypothetical protein
VAWQLVTDAMDHAPPGLTVAERFVLVVVAEFVGRDPRLPARECECSTSDLARRTGLAIRGVQDALVRLAGRGMDIRVPLAAGKDGRPVYTFRGRVPRYRLPSFVAPDGCECQLCHGFAVSSPSPVDNSAQGSATVHPSASEGHGPTDPSGEKGPSQRAEGSAVTSGRVRPSGPPPVAGSPVAAAARVPSPVNNFEAAALARRLDIELTDAMVIITEVQRQRAPVRNLAGLLRSIPDDDLRTFLSTPTAPAVSPLPPPCGQCDARPGDPPAARTVDDDAGRPRPCPRCHPKVTSHAS